MLSAYIIEKRKRKDQNVVSVIGLEDNKDKYSDFTCCFRSNNGDTIVEHVRSSEHHVFSYENSPFRRVQYTCPLPMMSKSFKWVSISTAFNKTCNKDAKYYVAVQTPSQGELAVCTTVLYGSLSANLLLEWFEVQRILGVDKVISYTKNLNDDAMKVLEYYESLGLTDIIHVAGFPTRDKDIRLSDNTDRVWINQEVFALDCHTRILKYVHVPSRTHIASPILHNFNPEDGFKRYEASPTDVTLHHYRSCQKYFGKLFKSDSTNVEERKLNIYDIAVSTCQKIPQFKQKNIEIIANILKPGY
ncbi:unnamed protein product [Mytilus edulis]|uniref:Glycosyltransferase family 92 protein n=1 Tax=Mytilus edulis TaxID=6550 RepID=A0A8S3RX56_MYTED|nr:unnamed protein product [Mytilus edulis]